MQMHEQQLQEFSPLCCLESAKILTPCICCHTCIIARTLTLTHTLTLAGAWATCSPVRMGRSLS